MAMEISSVKHYTLDGFLKALVEEGAGVAKVTVCGRQAAHLVPGESAVYILAVGAVLKMGGSVEYEGYCEIGHGVAAGVIPAAARLALQSIQAVCRLHGIHIVRGSDEKA